MTRGMAESICEDDLPFSSKIAVVTVMASINEEDFHSADLLVKRYGPDKVIHFAWPENFMAEQDKLDGIINRLLTDREIKVLVLNQAVPGTNAMVDRLRETRDDIFIVYCTVNESTYDTIVRANLILMIDEPGMGPGLVMQAKKQGARTFVHYSFPRHMALNLPSTRRDLIKEACDAEGIQFLDLTAPDATEAGIAAAQQFILEDVPKLTAKYGEDTAFFCTNCTLQAPLIKAVVDCHAIYPQSCCPSPYHGFPQALGIKTDGDFTDLNYVITETCRIAEERNMTDRLSTWSVSASTMFVNAGAEYAIKRISGKIPANRIDDRVLEDCMYSYIREVVGEGVEVTMTSYSENGVIHENFKLVLMSYLDF